MILPAALEHVAISARAPIAVGLPTLERAVVDLGNDAGGGLQGSDPIVSRLHAVVDGL
jgi:hypothetical protein